MCDEEEEEVIICNNCSWEGDDAELVCSEEDAKSNKEVRNIAFNICPQCDQILSLEG